MVGIIAFERHFTAFILFVAAVFLYGGNQLVGIILIIIDLRRFQAHLVHSYFLCQTVYFFYLVFIMPHYQKLENYKRCLATQFLFPFHNVGGSLQYFVQFSAYPVLLVGILRGTIYGD